MVLHSHITPITVGDAVSNLLTSQVCSSHNSPPFHLELVSPLASNHQPVIDLSVDNVGSLSDLLLQCLRVPYIPDALGPQGNNSFPGYFLFNSVDRPAGTELGAVSVPYVTSQRADISVRELKTRWTNSNSSHLPYMGPLKTPACVYVWQRTCVLCILATYSQFRVSFLYFIQLLLKTGLLVHYFPYYLLS